MGSSRTVLRLKDTLRTKISGLGFKKVTSAFTVNTLGLKSVVLEHNPGWN